MVHLPNKPEADAQLMNDHPPFSISAPFYGFLQKEVETRINWESHTKPFAQKASVLPIRKKVYSYLILPIMQRPRFALVKATLIWCSSVTNPSFWLSHPRLGSCSIWESGKDRTSDMITKSFSLPRGEKMGDGEIGEIASCLFLEGILLLHAYTT